MELITTILREYNDCSLEKLAEHLPSSLTSDCHILKGEEYYNQQKYWEAFHHFSLTHSTLLYHKYFQKQFQNSSSSGLNQNAKDIVENDNLVSFMKNLTFNEELNVLRPESCQETLKLLRILPKDWTVVQVTSENRVSGNRRMWRKAGDDLELPPVYISRCTCGPSPSIIMKRVRPPSMGGGVKSLLQELESIRGENKVISNHYSNDYTKYVQKKEEINNRLKLLVQSIEMSWLKCLSCLFLGRLDEDQTEIATKIIQEAAKSCQLSFSPDQLQLLLPMATFPKTSSKLNQSLPFDFSLRAGLATLLNQSVRSEEAKALESSLSKESSKLDKIAASLRGPVILILDKSIVSLPWEMITPLRGNPVTRMPSLQSLVSLYLVHFNNPNSLLSKGVDPSNGFFILDPENNLTRTQARLKDTFETSKWPGVTGKAPPHDQYQQALENRDVVVYVGHGSGSQYMPSKIIDSTRIRSAVMLFGCSSLALNRRGAAPDPWGVILSYLLASCPCVVGMLWEVMDKDTDLLTKEIMRAMNGQQNTLTETLDGPWALIPYMVARARPLCEWYLISSAFVVYGLPLKFNVNK